MAAGLGFKTFTSGEVLTAGDTNGYLMQGINVFANASARTAAITSPQEGQYSYLKDTNALEYYDGAAWVGAPVGDITAVTAGKGLTGGGSSGDVTVSLATTAKGDLVVGTGASTAGVLSVSSDGSTIVADSAATTGLRWQAPVQQNPILNSAMQIWQRGTSTACSTTAYAADRWQAYRAVAGATVSRQVTNDTTNLPNIQYAARVQRDSGNTATNAIFISQSLETINSIQFVGKTVTLSFYARAGANYSAASSALNIIVSSGTGTDQNVLTSYTGANNFISQTGTLTTTWQRFTYTGTVPTTATELGTYIYYTPAGTAGANDYFEITGVQLEVGSVATPFHTYAATIQGELAACQRYYQRVDSANASDTRMNTANMVANSTTVAYGNFPFPVRMRTSPTFGSSTATGWSLGRINAALTALGQERSSQYSAMVRATVASGLTAGSGDWLEAGNNNTAYIEFSAEL